MHQTCNAVCDRTFALLGAEPPCGLLASELSNAASTQAPEPCHTGKMSTALWKSLHGHHAGMAADTKPAAHTRLQHAHSSLACSTDTSPAWRSSAADMSLEFHLISSLIMAVPHAVASDSNFRLAAWSCTPVPTCPDGNVQQVQGALPACTTARIREGTVRQNTR
jgi:hypothetical protein